MSLVREVIEQEVNDLMKKSMEYSNGIKTAKTKTKQKYLTKKLKRNNELLSGMLISLNKLSGKKTNDD